jgi:hypothetical protein
MSNARQTLQALLAESLADPSVQRGYALTAISFGDAVEITLEKGGAMFVVWLRPASDESAYYKQTARLKIGYRRDPPDAMGYALVDALCARIAAWEQSLGDDGHRQLFQPQTDKASGSAPEWPFLEWLAVRSGLKPTCRTVAHADAAERLIEEARANRMHVVACEARAFVSDFCTDQQGEDTIVYVGRTEQAVAAAAAAERAMMETCARRERVSAAQVRALGAALGYPSCCVEAFIPVRDCSNSEIRFRALRRTARASMLLNDIGDGRVLVSYSVCRYDCGPSIRYGQALLDAFARLDPGGAKTLQRALRGIAVAFVRGGLRLLPAAETVEGEIYRFAAVEGIGEGELFQSWRAAVRRGDGIDLQGSDVRVLSGSEELCRLSAPPDQVQIRAFA